LSLYLDGNLLAKEAFAGHIQNDRYPVNLGKNAETQGQNYAGELSNAILDEVQIYDQALSEDQIQQLMKGPSANPSEEAVLWLRFETIEEDGEFYSVGIGARTYGLVWPDRRVQPELWQVKKTPQPAKVDPVDLIAGKVKITNRHNFTNLRELQLTWSLLEDGSQLQGGSTIVDVEPRESKFLEVPLQMPALKPAAEYRLRFNWTLPEETLWAEKGHEVAWDEFEIPYDVPGGPRLSIGSLSALSLKESDPKYLISGGDESECTPTEPPWLAWAANSA